MCPKSLGYVGELCATRFWTHSIFDIKDQSAARSEISALFSKYLEFLLIFRIIPRIDTKLES